MPFYLTPEQEDYDQIPERKAVMLLRPCPQACSHTMFMPVRGPGEPSTVVSTRQSSGLRSYAALIRRIASESAL